jgi:hypothetical protein
VQARFSDLHFLCIFWLGVTSQQKILTPPWHLILPSHLSGVCVVFASRIMVTLDTLLTSLFCISKIGDWSIFYPFHNLIETIICVMLCWTFFLLLSFLWRSNTEIWAQMTNIKLNICLFVCLFICLFVCLEFFATLNKLAVNFHWWKREPMYIIQCI